MVINKIKSKDRPIINISNLVFIFVCVLIIISITIFTILGERDNNEFLSDYSIYKKNVELISSGNFTNVQELKTLSNKYKDEYKINLLLGGTYLASDNNNAALLQYSKAIDNNPYLIEDTDYMYQFAVSLANTKNYENARLVIKEARPLSNDSSYQANLDELLLYIDQIEGEI